MIEKEVGAFKKGRDGTIGLLSRSAIQQADGPITGPCRLYNRHTGLDCSIARIYAIESASLIGCGQPDLVQRLINSF